MKDLSALGNAIRVVEHDPDVIRAADHLLDLGPGAGELGGHLLASGTVKEVTANPNSITGKYLSGRLTIPVPKYRREPGREHLKLTGARIHNLRGVSFDVPRGRCDVCEGDGTVTVEMQFLADIELPCEECSGTRYKSQILEIKYKGKTIYDVLNMTVKEALIYFAGHPKIVDKLYVLEEVGLGYVRLGQSATTLSGGEAQRVKLASHLAPARSITTRSANDTAAKIRSRTLYILDEPTTGLHFDDVAKLLAAFRKLIEGGGSLLVIEHNLDVIKSADWVIDMGPEGGSGGGQIVATGTPEEIAANPRSHTGHWLAPVLHLPASKVEPELDRK